MKQYTPGQILTAEDLNKSFAETNRANKVVIEGKEYEASGLFRSIPKFSYSQKGDYYVATLRLPAPYIPPDGYYFEAFAASTTGFTFVQTCSTALVEGTVNCRVLQIASNNTGALGTVGWRLTSMQKG